MKKNILFILIVSAGFAKTAFAQDYHFSQFYSNPLLFNPAAAGTSERGFRAASNFKNQWQSVSAQPYRTTAISADKAFLKNNMLGVGVSFYNDEAGGGQLNTTNANFSVASNKNLNKKNNLSVGLQAGYIQKTVDISNLTWENQYDGSAFSSAISSGEQFNNVNIKQFDFATGIQHKLKLDNNSRIVTGIAVHHVTRPKNSFITTDYKQLTRATFIVNGRFNIKNTNLSILPSMLYQRQGSAQELVAGSMVRYKLGDDSHYTGIKASSALFLGMHYRVGDALIPVLLFDYKHYCNIGVSYDITLSKLSKINSTRGGIEFSISIPVDDAIYKTTTATKHKNTRNL